MVRNYNYKYLLGILNSNISNWYFCNFLSEGLHFYPNDAKEMPIPKVVTKKQLPIIELVDEILMAKASDSDADTANHENEIDQLVYELYELTPDEIAIVESSI